MKRLHWKTYSSGGYGFMSAPVDEARAEVMQASLLASPDCYDIEVKDADELDGEMWLDFS